LRVFACHDGGRRPPPGGLPYGVEHCVVIRGIREIRGYDQPGLEIAVIPNVLECGLYRRTPNRRCARTTARWAARRVIVPLERRASAVCTRASSMA
jgi:hypothetical protein